MRTTRKGRKKGVRVLVLTHMPIVLRVKELRLRKGWTEAQLAAKAGIERRATIYELEKRSAPQRVNLEVLAKIAKALGVSTLSLLRED